MGIYKNLFRLAMAMKVEENVMSGEISSALSVGGGELIQPSPTSMNLS